MCRSPRPLAALTACRIDQCTCGHLHLHVGPVTLRVTPDVLEQLADVSWLALTALRSSTMHGPGEVDPQDPSRP